jgi:hypothetical protein
MSPIRDEFLSEEDLDLRNLSTEELAAYWRLWLLQAQASNDLDRRSYSHGVFVLTSEPVPEDEQERPTRRPDGTSA